MANDASCQFPRHRAYSLWHEFNGMTKPNSPLGNVLQQVRSEEVQWSCL
jgi:hypothetical protein